MPVPDAKDPRDGRTSGGAATNPVEVDDMSKHIRTLLEWLLQLLLPAPGRRRAVDAATPALPHAGVPVPALPRVPASGYSADPPTLHLPRIPLGERFPIAWDTEPVGAYVIQYERQRTLEAAR